MQMIQNTIILAIVALVAVSGGATGPVEGFSADTPLDTRTMSRVAAVEDKSVDSRSYTVDWSIAGTLNTKKIIGTMFLVR